jgi:hypothetical protein
MAAAFGVGQFGDRPFADQFSAGDDHDPVHGLLDLGQQVAGDEDRSSLVVGEVLKEVTQPLDALGVQAIGRLVEDEYLRITEQDCCQPESLPHPHRVAAGLALTCIGHPDLRQDGIGTLIRQAGSSAVDAKMVAPAATRVKGGLQDRADLRARTTQRRVRSSAIRSGTRVRSDQAHRHSQSCGLARTVRSEEPGHLPWFDDEGQAVDGLDSAESFGEVGDNHSGRGGGRRVGMGRRAHGPIQLAAATGFPAGCRAARVRTKYRSNEVRRPGSSGCRRS